MTKTADCYKFCLALYKELEKSPDFTCLYEHEVTDFFAEENNKITAIETTQGQIEADEFVVAAGNGSTHNFQNGGYFSTCLSIKRL